MRLLRFCFFCGTGYSKDNWNDYDNFVCTICDAIFIPPIIIKETQITLEEAEAKFNEIPIVVKKDGRKGRKKK